MDWIWIIIVAARQASTDADDQWAARLSSLDSVRARAFARGDVGLLDEVYIAGSPARASDAAAISAYARRGGKVTGAELRILSCRVVAASDDSARLDIVERLAPARMVWADGSSTRLPLDRPSRRLVTLQRTRDGWRIASVS